MNAYDWLSKVYGVSISFGSGQFFAIIGDGSFSDCDIYLVTEHIVRCIKFNEVEDSKCDIFIVEV